MTNAAMTNAAMTNRCPTRCGDGGAISLSASEPGNIRVTQVHPFERAPFIFR